MKNIFLFLAISFIFLFSISFISAEACTNIGESANGKYCDVDRTLKSLKADQVSCLNDYECVAQSCAEGVCASKYSSIVKSGSELNKIWNALQGLQCTPGTTSCSDKVYIMCGATGLWENKGNVDGKCGYTATIGGGGSSSINIIISSPKNITYDTTQILLQVRDRDGIANYWKYSLNGVAKINFTSGITITARAGSNSLTVYASKTSYSSEESKTIIFNVVASVVSSYCGDKICSSNEDCTDCSKDCGVCVGPIYIGECGDGTCDADESSYTCSEDCEAETPTSYWWIVILIIILILSLTIYLLRHKIENSQWFQKLFPKQGA